MKLGFVSAILPDLSLEEIIQFAAQEQFDCVELMCWPKGKANRKYAGVTHIDAVGFNSEKAKEVNHLLQEYKISISGLGFYPNVLANNREYAQQSIDHIKYVIDAAKQLGIQTVNTFIGADHTKNIEYNFEKFTQVWPDIISFAEARNIRIGIENCPMLFSYDEWPAGKNLAASPAIWRRMFEAIPSKHFGLNYDPSHLIWQFIDYCAPLEAFKDRLFHTHAKDLKIDKHKLNNEGILALGWSTPKIPGYGEIDWGKYFSALSDTGYNGAVCIEVEDDAFSGSLEARKQSLRISRNVLKPYFPQVA